jgi:chloramphenicol 3-O phosphotransferase
MSPARAGRIVVLNGTSSSGKSTLAKALQAALPGPALVIGIDTFVFALPQRYLDQPLWSEVFRYVRDDGASDGPFRIETGPLGQELISGMHRSVAALATAGLDVIVDHVLLEVAWLDECRRLWADLDWWLIGVRCPLAVVEERERERRDRTLGQAAAQFAVVHAHGGSYDVEVDTSELTPDAAAARIVAAIGRRYQRTVTGTIPVDSEARRRNASP